MKKEIHTVPVVEALHSGDECPFCYLHRQATQRAIRYFAGPSASYMEPQVRGITNRLGFCREHTKSLYDYGNASGSALMMQTHLEYLMLQLQQARAQHQPPAKKGLFQKKTAPENETNYAQQLDAQIHSCAICDKVEESMHQQYRVFFDLTKEAEFRRMVEHSKGFCFVHFQKLLEDAPKNLPASQEAWFYDTIYAVMESNLQRVKADLDHLVKKFDYRFQDAPWGNAKDALQRSMQKVSGIYPADGPYRKD